MDGHPAHPADEPLVLVDGPAGDRAGAEQLRGAGQRRGPVVGPQRLGTAQRGQRAVHEHGGNQAEFGCGGNGHIGDGETVAGTVGTLGAERVELSGHRPGRLGADGPGRAGRLFRVRCGRHQ